MPFYSPVAANYSTFPQGSTINASVTFTPNYGSGSVTPITGTAPPTGEVSAPSQGVIVNGALQKGLTDTSRVQLLSNTTDLNLDAPLQYSVEFSDVMVDGVRIFMKPFSFYAVTPRTVTDGAITAPTATLTSSTAAFTTDDVGAAVSVAGAGVGGADLLTTISSFTNTTTVVLSADSATSVAGAALTIARELDLITVTPLGFVGATGYTRGPAIRINAGSFNGSAQLVLQNEDGSLVAPITPADGTLLFVDNGDGTWSVG